MKTVLIFWGAQIRKKFAPLLMLTLLSLLSSLLISGPGVAEHYLFSKWKESASRTDLIIGYKGSPLQIVANTLYRMENPTGNLRKESVDYWQRHPMVSSSCRVALGDNFGGHPIVGVDTNYFDWMEMELVHGRWPKSSDELVVSEQLKDQLELNLGSEIHSAHGSDDHGDVHEHHHLRIVGTFKGSRGVDNEALFTAVEAYYEMHNEAEAGSVTALMLRLKTKTAMIMLPKVLESRPNEQGAFPVFIFAQLQKQWAPTLEKFKTYGRALPISVALLFLAFVYYLGKSERDALRFLKVIKTPVPLRYVTLYGLMLIFTCLGVVIHFAVLNALGYSPTLVESVASFFLVGLSALMLVFLKR